MLGGPDFPCMTTVSGVLPKLLNGADLMMPGIVTNPAKKGKMRQRKRR